MVNFSSLVEADHTFCALNEEFVSRAKVCRITSLGETEQTMYAYFDQATIGRISSYNHRLVELTGVANTFDWILYKNHMNHQNLLMVRVTV